LIGDNSTYLYCYEIGSKQIKKFPLVENPNESIIKKSKPDFEAITLVGDSLYIFGSGSKKNRNLLIQFDLNTMQAIAITDLTNLYHSLMEIGNIAPDDFNIEGALFDGTTWFLFNRGNGKLNKNIVFSISGNDLIRDYKITATAFKLPEINGVMSSFTDAILDEQTIYFLASAEKTNSTYNDGEVVGSLIGSIDKQNMKLGLTRKISDNKKFEGITLVNKTEQKIEFYLCEDNDTEAQESVVYELSINL
jgi:hypothetical protein